MARKKTLTPLITAACVDYFQHGRTTAQLAAAANVTPNAIRMRRYRAMKLLPPELRPLIQRRPFMYLNRTV